MSYYLRSKEAHFVRIEWNQKKKRRKKIFEKRADQPPKAQMNGFVFSEGLRTTQRYKPLVTVCSFSFLAKPSLFGTTVRAAWKCLVYQWENWKLST